MWSFSQSGSYSTYCNDGLQPAQPQQTFLFLIRTFLAPRQSHWLQFFPCDQANLRFPSSVCMAGCSKHPREPPVSKTKPQHCNYDMTINRANQQLTQQHLSSTQAESAALCDPYKKTHTHTHTHTHKPKEYHTEDPLMSRQQFSTSLMSVMLALSFLKWPSAS